MNKYILNLAGFTPEEWEALRARVLNKILFYWRKISAVITLRRLRNIFVGFIVVALLVFGIQFGMKYLGENGSGGFFTDEDPEVVVQPRDTTVETTLEELRRQTQEILEEDQDLFYPSLELQLDLVE